MFKRANPPENPLGLSRHQAKMLADMQRIWQKCILNILRSEELTTPWAIGVTSSIHGEGKSTASIGLATTLALETGAPVALVETDLRNPTFAKDFGVDVTPGLADYLLGNCTLEETFRQTELPNLTVLPVGEKWKTLPESPFDNLSSTLRRRMPQVLGTLWEQFSYSNIILDLPPIMGDFESGEMVRLLDGTLLVIRAGSTPLERIRETAEILADGRLLGVVHTGPNSAIPGWMSHLLSA